MESDNSFAMQKGGHADNMSDGTYMGQGVGSHNFDKESSGTYMG